jgi:hypothetical protein
MPSREIVDTFNKKEAAMGMPLASRPLAWATFWLMTGRLLLAAIPLVGNAATVLFTFYPPLRAHWAFYLGLTLVVVGTWLVTLNLALMHRAWRARYPETRTPLPAFMAMVTFARRDGDLFPRAAPARADGDASPDHDRRVNLSSA